MSEKVLMTIKGRPKEIRYDGNIEQLASLCYTAYAVYLSGQGVSVPAWEDANEFSKQASVSDVNNILTNIERTAEDVHVDWKSDKEKNGWVYGVNFNSRQKIHPDLVAYSSLPASRLQKDIIYWDTITSNVSVVTV